jgi:hypothetical protein
MAASAWAGDAAPLRLYTSSSLRLLKPADEGASRSSSHTGVEHVSHSEELRWRTRAGTGSAAAGNRRGVKQAQLLEPIHSPRGSFTQDGPADLLLQPGSHSLIQPDTPGTQPESGMPNLRRQPGLGELSAPPPKIEEAPCPSPADLRKIYDISISLRDDMTQGTDLPRFCPLGDTLFAARSWSPLTYTWKASALCHKPLYFEEPDLERYGHTWGHLQPLVSGAHFFGTFPVLPYKMGIEAPWECIYALGYYEPGSCAPYIIPPLPLNLRGALLEAGAWTGGVILIP